MAVTGLSNFDHTVHQTNIWLDDVMEELGIDDRQTAYHALRAVLQTLRDRITPHEAAHLSAQLPMLVRGIFYEGWHPAHKPNTGNVDDFLKLVSERTMAPIETQPEKATQSVFRVLSKHLVGEAEHVKDNLPEDIRALWN